jgi:23S rRNA pseudouridine1911/1915/1917 synthase
VSEAPRLIEVEPPEAGRRLDVFLAERLGLSRAQTRRLLGRGGVRVDGRALSEKAKGLPVRAGEVISVAPFTPPSDQQAVAEPERPLAVLASGPDWLAVDKPAGVPVHPLEPDERGTLLGAVLARHPEIHGVGEGALRSGVVHRLDVGTSGVVLFALAEERWRTLREAFAEHRVEKVYRAMVCGRLEGAGDEQLPLLMARHRPARVRVASHEEAANARGVWRTALAWRSLEVFGDATLVEVRPVTGFLHQIRATFAHLGHPLLGDRSYGATQGEERHMLHAARVAFEDVRAESPDAPDFAAVLMRLRERA